MQHGDALEDALTSFTSTLGQLAPTKPAPYVFAQAPSSLNRAAASALIAIIVSHALSTESAVSAGAVAKVLTFSAGSTLGVCENASFPSLLSILVGARDR